MLGVSMVISDGYFFDSDPYEQQYVGMEKYKN